MSGTPTSALSRICNQINVVFLNELVMVVIFSYFEMKYLILLMVNNGSECFECPSTQFIEVTVVFLK